MHFRRPRRTRRVEPSGLLGKRTGRGASRPLLVLLATSAGLGCEGGASMMGLTTMPGMGGTGGSNPEPLLPNPEIPLPHACEMRVTDLAVYQGVKIPLMRDDQPVPLGSVPLVAGRRAFFRAYLGYGGSAPTPGNAIARLRVESSAGVQELEAKGLAAEPSSEAQLESSLNFDVPGELIRPDTRVSLTLHTGGSCPAGGLRSYPASGALNLATTDTGVLKVVLVPIQYDADGSGRLPNLTDEQLRRYRELLLAVYPTREVEITVREPLASRISITNDSGWANLLEALREQRARDTAANDVYYYGLVDPAANFGAYCGTACVAGLSYLVENLSATRLVGLGVGFATGNIAGETLIHELGHQHGRGHSPCGNGAAIDPRFPHAGGGIGEWGLDTRTVPPRLMNPATRKDIMGYCPMQWISDYTYAALATRRSAISVTGTSAREIRSLVEGPVRAGRTLLLDGAGRAAWGRPWQDEASPSGKPETARVLDESGAPIAEITVYRTGYGHGAGASLDVPAPRAGWATLSLDGVPPIAFAAPSSVPSLEPARQ